MKDLRTLVDELNQMIMEKKILEAFEKFYAEDVVMQDNDYPQRVGKEICRQFEEDFVNGLTAFRDVRIVNTIISDDIAAIESWYDYSHKDFGDRNYKQVSIQRWKNGKIIEEKFYYNN